MLRKPEVYLWQQVSKLFIYVPWYRVIVVALVIKFMLLNFSFFFFGISPLRHIIFISFYLILDIPKSFPLLDFLFSIYLWSNVFWLANAQRTADMSDFKSWPLLSFSHVCDGNLFTLMVLQTQ